jgi:lactoylglutathione lyase
MRLGAIYTLYLSLPDDSYYIELTVNETADEDWPRDMGSAHIAIVVEDLDSVLAHLTTKGITPVTAPTNPGGRSDVRVAFLQGPSGYRVELIDGGEFRPPRESLPAALGSYD